MAQVATYVLSGNLIRAGLTVSANTTARDTLGVLVTAVTAGSAAEKAGLEEGNRIASINGVNLRLHPADAGQVDMQGIMQRRFQREMNKMRPGDTVKLSIYADSRFRDVSLSLEPLRPSAFHPFMTREDAERASLGAIVGGTASKRDTLGVLITDVAENGPLARSGIYEGSRIAAIGGVDLRVPAASAGEAKASSDKANLLVTELGKLTPGGRVELRVYDSGRFRNVSIQTMRRGDVDMPAGSGPNWILNRDGNVIHFNKLQLLGDDFGRLKLHMDTTLQLLDRHVIKVPRVDDMTRLRIERTLQEVPLKLMERLSNIPQWQLLNGRRIAASK
jgi:predicted metalloprotease with PDZ domain